MKSKNLLYIIIILLFVSPACNKHKATVDGFVKDIGTQQPIGGLLVSIVKSDGTGEYGAGNTKTDASGYFKCDFEIQSGFTYQLRCEDVDPAKTTWYWVDVNHKANPLNVNNSGEDLTKEKTQHKDIWMGRFAGFDSLVFHTDVPFVKGDLVQMELTDTFLFSNKGYNFSPGKFDYIGKDTLYDFYYNGNKTVLGNCGLVLIKMSGTKQGKTYIYQDTVYFPADYKRIVKKIVP